jgi:predicted flavoprotein YhiN
VGRRFPAVHAASGGATVLGRFQIQGKGAFKEEFVTCGGVELAEVDFRSMESKVCGGFTW